MRSRRFSVVRLLPIRRRSVIFCMALFIGCTGQAGPAAPVAPTTCTVFFWAPPGTEYSFSVTGNDGSSQRVNSRPVPSGDPPPANFPATYVQYSFMVTVAQGVEYYATATSVANGGMNLSPSWDYDWTQGMAPTQTVTGGNRFGN